VGSEVAWTAGDRRMSDILVYGSVPSSGEWRPWRIRSQSTFTGTSICTARQHSLLCRALY